MVRILIDVNNLSQVLVYYDRIKVHRSTSEDGSYTEITSSGTRIVLIPESEQYYYSDDDGTTTHWYKTSYYNTVSLDESELSGALKGGAEVEKVGYTFGNYKPPPNEWGDIYTPDDFRYTMMWGIDSIGSDVAQTEWEDEQFRQIAREAVSEFEAYLTMDIRRKSYVTRPADALIQSRLWREGVDYTDEDDPYDFDPQYWTKFGFIQLRHWPLIKVTRAIWYSPVEGEVMNMIDNQWIRVEKQFGQLHMFPTGGFSYGPYSVYGPLWTRAYGAPYPDGFQFDYETGYKNADLVPDSLRSTIAKYATIKCLAVIGDGLLAGFSSQSVSLDGLSESFSSTQSATSAFFGARIAQYAKEIDAWLVRNRNKFAPIPISFVT
jgi:hypothetical protein